MDRLRWSRQHPGERVLRVWLGGTFTYAGVQKLADPGFLKQGSATYIGSQLDGFAQGSPIAPLLHLAGHAPQLTGVATAITEILIGLATLAGVAPLIAASVGTLLSISLWLSASWHIHPYFLGSDSIYAVAWIAYGLSLPTAAVLMRAAHERVRPKLDVADSYVADERRRTLIRGGAVVGLGAALAGFAALVGRSRSTNHTNAGATTNTPSPSSTPTSSVDPTATPSVTSTGEVIADLPTLTSDGAVDFTDPSGGSAVVVALASGSVAAFSRRCTHSGCTADYDDASKLIVCPCHGSRFDPENGGAPVNGPATQPLQSIPVEVDPSSGVVRLS